MAEPRIAFKAGRAFRREGTNWVDPSPTKGAVILQNGGEDGLLHFIWKNRSTNESEEVRVFAVSCYWAPKRVPFEADERGADIATPCLAGFDSLPWRCELCEGRPGWGTRVRPQVLVVGSEAFREWSA